MEITGTETRLDPLIRNDPFPFYKALREHLSGLLIAQLPA